MFAFCVFIYNSYLIRDVLAVEDDAAEVLLRGLESLGRDEKKKKSASENGSRGVEQRRFIFRQKRERGERKQKKQNGGGVRSVFPVSRAANLSLHAGVYELQPGAVQVPKRGGDAAARHRLRHGVNLWIHKRKSKQERKMNSERTRALLFSSNHAAQGRIDEFESVFISLT